LSGPAVPKIAYCTIADNLCSSGAAIGSAATVPVEVTASILWGNKFTSGTTINNLSGPATVKYCTTQTTSYNTATNTTNNTSNPLFLRDYHLQLKMVPGDGYSLSAGSPMIDRGAPASGASGPGRNMPSGGRRALCLKSWTRILVVVRQPAAQVRPVAAAAAWNAALPGRDSERPPTPAADRSR
jgi:hypothetical protein